MNSEIKGAWKHRELRILVIGEGVSCSDHWCRGWRSRGLRRGSSTMIGGVLAEPSLLGTRLTLFSGGLVTATAALLLAGPAVRRVHTAADVSVASEATGVMS